jgi:hypothetical protein
MLTLSPRRPVAFYHDEPDSIATGSPPTRPALTGMELSIMDPELERMVSVSAIHEEVPR